MRIEFDGYDYEDVNGQVLTFSEIPNILSIKQNVVGTYASIAFKFLKLTLPFVLTTAFSMVFFGEFLTKSASCSLVICLKFLSF